MVHVVVIQQHLKKKRSLTNALSNKSPSISRSNSNTRRNKLKKSNSENKKNDKNDKNSKKSSNKRVKKQNNSNNNYSNSQVVVNQIHVEQLMNLV